MITNQNLSNMYAQLINKKTNEATSLTIATMTLFGRSNDIVPHGPSVE